MADAAPAHCSPGAYVCTSVQAGRNASLQAEVATALESFFRVGAAAGGKTNDRFDALMQAHPAMHLQNLTHLPNASLSLSVPPHGPRLRLRLQPMRQHLGLIVGYSTPGAPIQGLMKAFSALHICCAGAGRGPGGRYAGPPHYLRGGQGL